MNNHNKSPAFYLQLVQYGHYLPIYAQKEKEKNSKHLLTYYEYKLAKHMPGPSLIQHFWTV